MSVFNGEAFLVEAMESILGQTFRNFEFVIIDDGSTDSTPKILTKFATQDERIRILRHANMGRAESLNVGIGLANGKYIARMDADDIAISDRLYGQTEFMDLHPQIGLLGGAVDLIDANGQFLRTIQPPLEDSQIRSVLAFYNPIHHPTAFMRKEVVLASGGYRKALLDADDYDLFLRIGERSRLACLDKPVLQYRIHAAQTSVRNLGDQILCILAARTAASLRRRGDVDPLLDIEKVTPQLLNSLGLTTVDMQQALVEGYSYWMGVLRQHEPEAALGIIDEIFLLSRSGCVEQSLLSNVWLAAAEIHYRQGRIVEALVAAGHAIVVRPMVAGRPLKRAFMRLSAGLKANQKM
jgi:Glycosyl transferase family 2